MTTAFQSNAFQNNAFQIDVATGNIGVAGRAVATTFTRKRWKEIEAAWKAQYAAEERVIELEPSVEERRELHLANKLAEYAILLAEAENELNVTKLKNALAAEAGARTLNAALQDARRVSIVAKFMIQQVEDDEEDSIMLLLS